MHVNVVITEEDEDYDDSYILYEYPGQENKDGIFVEMSDSGTLRAPKHIKARGKPDNRVDVIVGI